MLGLGHRNHTVRRCCANHVDGSDHDHHNRYDNHRAGDGIGHRGDRPGGGIGNRANSPGDNGHDSGDAGETQEKGQEHLRDTELRGQ